MAKNKKLELLQRLDKELTELLDEKNFESNNYRFENYEDKAWEYNAYLNNFISANPTISLSDQGINFVSSSLVLSKLNELRPKYNLHINYENLLRNQTPEPQSSNQKTFSNQTKPGLFSDTMTMSDRKVSLTIDSINIQSKSMILWKKDERVTVRLRVGATIPGEYQLFLYVNELRFQDSFHSFKIYLNEDYEDVTLTFKSNGENFKNIQVEFCRARDLEQGLRFTYIPKTKKGEFLPF
jgi:hypothetical protein